MDPQDHSSSPNVVYGHYDDADRTGGGGDYYAENDQNSNTSSNEGSILVERRKVRKTTFLLQYSCKLAFNSSTVECETCY